MADLSKENGFFKNAFHFFPQAAMVFNGDLKIVFKNRAADDLPAGLFPSSFKDSVKKILDSKSGYKKRAVYKYADGDREKEISVLIKGSVLEYKGCKYALLIIQDMAEVMEVGDVVNICSNCKKIKRSESSWQVIESYIQENFAAVRFSHGICDDCSEELYKK